MKKRSFFLLSVGCLLVCGACNSRGVDLDLQQRSDEGVISHGEIILGEKLDNPYAVENVKSAVTKLYPSKSRDIIQTTHYYVRFLPVDDAQLDLLKSLGLTLLDHPIDYRIAREGDFYHDPAIDQQQLTWQYSVVPYDFEFPEIEYEILEDCFLAEGQEESKALAGIDWNAVEDEAFRISGNEDMISVPSGTKGEQSVPSGRITIIDEYANGGQPFGVSGVKVECNVFIKFASAYTDRDGYYELPKKFSANPRYRLVFTNEKSFSIGFNSVLYKGSISTLGKGSAAGMDASVNTSSDPALFRRCVANNAVYDYMERCAKADLNLPLPPSGLCLWMFDNMDVSSATMLHHGTIFDTNSQLQYFKLVSWIVEFFGPDITIGTKGLTTYRQIYSAVCHELAHASHFTKVGRSFWNQLIIYIASCALDGQDTYGDGTLPGAGYCYVAECWAYYMESKLYQDRYSGANPNKGSSYWFHPQVLTYLENRGINCSDIIAAMTSDVVDRDSFREKLLELYPEKKTVIIQAFNRYE